MRDGYALDSLPRSLDAVVISLCADYARRERVISEDGSVSARTAAELRYINYIIINAAAEIADARYVRTFIDEIGSRTGYAHSAVEGMSEITYKKQKSEIKLHIAKRLHLYG